MKQRSGQPPTDFDIGYRRPPRANQFQPGQSGNPRGRPKGSPSDASELLSQLNAKGIVTLTFAAQQGWMNRRSHATTLAA